MENTNKNWIDFWKNRKMILEEKELSSMLAYEGGWYGACAVDTAEFIKYVNELTNYYKLSGSIYEIACGPGAFLYVFQSIGFKVGGLDINKDFIEFAKECIDSSDLSTCEACDVPIGKKYDFILISNSINYFPSKDYVYSTLSKCVEKMNKGILLTEVNDIEYYNEYRIECGSGAVETPDKNAENFFRTAERISFDKEFFIDFAEKFNLSVSFQKTNQFLHQGIVNNYRFSVFLTKNRE